LPQQEFTYLEVPTGQGVYTWSHYNANEFRGDLEVVPFIDQAKYIGFTCPITSIKTHQTKFSRYYLNPSQCKTKWISKFQFVFFTIELLYVVGKQNETDGSLNRLIPHRKMY
jgi:hypothetical protein